jgi:ABC-type amino acid transport substrate-binding protein
MKRILFLFASLLCLQGAQAAGMLDQIRSNQAITIAHRDASIPFSYLNADGKPIGYAMDLCLKIADAIKRELKLPTLGINYLSVTSSTRIPSIAQGKAAMECGSTTNTAERRKQVDYTIAHFISSARFLVRSDAGLGKVDDLANRTVVSTKGSTNLKTLERINAERALHMKIVEAADHGEAFSMVMQKKADAFAMDDVLLFGLRANSGQPEVTTVMGKPMTIEPYAIMLPKGDVALKRIVDTEMRRIILSGEINAIYRKWFEQPIPPKGINLALPMPYMLKDSFKYPSDKVADLAP